jgi:tetratricopeptide (TPR) repeat protein
MTPSFIIFFCGLLYVVIFWVLSLMRRERLSNQFAYEGLGLTGIAYAAVQWGGVAVHPIYFLFLIYLITMRARLLVELGNLFSKSGRHRMSLRLYHLSMHVFSDQSSRLIALINIGAAYLSMGSVDQAVGVLENARALVSKQLGPKHVAGCCFNLGMAYRRAGRHADALRQFAEVGDIYPMSVYAQRAERARFAALEEAGMATNTPKKESNAGV